MQVSLLMDRATQLGTENFVSPPSAQDLDNVAFIRAARIQLSAACASASTVCFRVAYFMSVVRFSSPLHADPW